MNKSADVVVIGAGIVGVSTALHLQMRGMKVLLIDRRDAGQETSYGNSGIIGNCYVLPFAPPAFKKIPRVALNRDTATHLHYLSLPSYLLWLIDFYRQSQPELRQVNGRLLRPLTASALEEHRFLMRTTDAERYLSVSGRVALHRSESSFAGSALERNIAHELGVPFEVMDAAAFGKIEPSLNQASYHKAVRWTGSARLTNPGAVTSAYAERFVRDGGVFQQTFVEALRSSTEGMWRVQTGQDEVCAKQVVVCAGPWASDIFKPLGYNFPLALKRGYHQHFSAIGSATLSHSIVDVDIGYVICPMEQGYRITTGVEFSGVDDASTPVQIARSLPFARQLFPLGDPAEEKAWHGNRPCFPDSLPLIGQAPRHKGLWFNIGHGHYGLTIGPSSGRLLAEMLIGAQPFCDPAPYRPERFTAASASQGR
jgi:D-amino-acid dehydrogenase